MNARRSVVSHTLVVAVALGVAQVLAYAVSVIAARRLGPEQFGVFAALLGILLIGSVLAMGIQAVAARRLVHLAPDLRGGASRDILRDGLIGGLAVAGATVLVSPLLLWLLRLDAWGPILLAAVAFIPITVAGAQYGVAQGRESYGRLAAVYLCVGLGRGIGGIAGALLAGTVLGTMAGLALGTIAGALVGQWVIAPLARGHGERVAHFFGETFHATHALLALFVLTNIDVLLARALLTPYQAGEYGVGAVIAKVAFWLPQFITVVAFPRFADTRRARATVVSLASVAGMGLLVVVATAALPTLVVGFVGGSAYEDLAPVAWMFAAIGALFALAQALLLTRLAVDDRRAVFAVWGSAALLAALAWLVMPRTVAGLAASALTAGAVLAVVGVVTTSVELRRLRYSVTTARGSGQLPGV
ncbi:MAG: oligosaccharide flippase family protein [Candidatus Nanopelagicales bacterium]